MTRRWRTARCVVALILQLLRRVTKLLSPEGVAEFISEVFDKLRRLREKQR